MHVVTELTPPKDIADLPEDAVWIHSPILCKDHFGVPGIAVYATEELAKLVFPNWSAPAIQESFDIVKIPFEEARQIAKTTCDSDGQKILAVHIHDECHLNPTQTHWID